MRLYSYSFFLPFLLLLWACSSSSKITSSWRSPDRATLSFKKVVVLGLVRDADRTIREEMEQYLTSALRNRGQWAECACELYGPKEFDQLNEQQARNAIMCPGI